MDDDGREADFEEERGGEVDVELLSAVQQEGEEKEEEKGMSSFPEAPPGSDPSARSTAVVGVRCPGYRYRVESKHAEDADFNDMDHYPFAIHAKRYPIPAWSVSCADGDVRLHALKTLTSSGCTDVCNGTGPFPTPCNACYDLEYNTKLKEIKKRAGWCRTDDAVKLDALNYDYLTYSQMVERAKYHHDKTRNIRLSRYNSSKKMERLRKSPSKKPERLVRNLDVYKRIVMMVGTEDIPGIKRVFGQALRKGRSVHALLALLASTVDGHYRARTAYDEKDLYLPTVVMKIGGPSLMHVLHQAADMPGVSWTQNQLRAGRAPKFWTCATGADTAIKAALQANIGNVVAAMKEDGRFTWTLMADEVAVNPRVKWVGGDGNYNGDNQAIGFCGVHTMSGVDTTVVDEDSLLDLKERLDSGDFHLGREATTLALAPIGGYSGTTFPVLCLPTCNASCPELGTKMFKTALEIWEQKAEDELGPITNIATGGDAERRRLLVEGYTTTDLRDLPGTWQKSLIELPLFNKQVGPRGISHNFDWKHMEKRKRQRDMCKTKGNQIGEGGTLNAETIIPVFDIIFGKKDWNPLFQPQDSQDISAVVRLMRKMCEAAAIDPSSFPRLKENVHLSRIHQDLKVRAVINEHMLAVLLGKGKGVADILRGLSCVSHLFLYLFRTNKDSFCPSQLYHDIQASVRSAFCMVARAMDVCPHRPFYFSQLGTDRLGQVFAFVRTITHSGNCDLLELSDRLSAATQLAHVWGSNPTWRHPSKRLNQGTADHNNTISWGEHDHIRVSGVDLRQCWIRGRDEAVSVLFAHPDYRGVTVDTFRKLDKAGATMFEPFGCENGMPGVGTEPEDNDVENDHGTEQTQEATRGAPGAPTSQSLPLGGGGDGDGGQEGTEQLARKVEGEEDRDMEMLFDTALERCTVSARSTVKLDITVNSVEMQKSRAVYSIFTSSTTTQMSTDRLRRVMGETVIVSPTASILDDHEPGCAANLSYGDPFVARVAVSTQGNWALGLFATTKAPASDDPDDAKKVHGALLRLEHKRVEASDSADEDEGGADEAWCWTGGVVKGPPLKLWPADVTPLNPEMTKSLDGYYFSLEILQRVWEDILTKADDGIALPIVTGARAAQLPYHPTLAQADAHVGRAQRAATAAKLQCKLCKVFVDAEVMHAHVGQHLLLERVTRAEVGDVAKRDDICGFCGVAGRCHVDVRTKGKGKRIQHQLQSTCDYAPKKDMQYNDVDISVARVRSSSVAEPCTNLPIDCKLCSSRGQTVSIWKYNFDSHVELRHGGPESSDAKAHEKFLESVKMGEAEVEAVKNLNKRTGRPSRKRGSIDDGDEEGSGRITPKRSRGHRGGRSAESE